MLRRKSSGPLVKQTYIKAGVILTVSLTVLTLILGWRIAHIINPTQVGATPSNSVSITGHSFLVYRCYNVISRGDSISASDDTVSYEFFRYPLDGSALRGESVVRMIQDGKLNMNGEPWMGRVSNDTLLLDRHNDVNDVDWIDASGNEFRPNFDWGGLDLKYGGLPSTNHDLTVYYDNGRRQVVLGAASGPLKSFPVPEPVKPIVWNENLVYLVSVPEIGGQPLSVYLLDLDANSLTEIESVRRMNFDQIDLHPASGKLVGIISTVNDNGLENTIGFSSVVLLDLNSGEVVELAGENEDYRIFSRPKISPDGSRVAYTAVGAQSDIWVSGLDLGGHEQRLISGTMLDWTPDGLSLVVDRDNELQLVSVRDGSTFSVDRRSGRYPDQDFHGVDYVGIVFKK